MIRPYDLCPDKKPTTDNNNDGCEDDSDGDGIDDTQDSCPNSKPQKDNNPKDGCEDDSDFDGVSDVSDKCPTKQGIDANICHGDSYGCPDIDEDGVPDFDDDGNHVDMCTPLGGPIFPDKPVQEDCNNFEDADGCPDEPKRAARKYIASLEFLALTNTATATTYVAAYVLPIPIYGQIAATGLFLAETAQRVLADRFLQQALDPPDTENYNKIFRPRQLQSKFILNITTQIPAEQQALIITSYDSANLIEAVTKSMERHSGAIIVGDYKAANLQARAVRSYSVRAANSLRAYANATHVFAQSKLFKDVDLVKLKQTANEFREGLLKQGVAGIPETERTALLESSDEQLLPLLYDELIDKERINKMRHPSEIFYEAASQAETMAALLDYTSKNYGSNVYLTSRIENNKINVGVFYQDAPNDAKWFVMVISKPASTKFFKLYKNSATKNLVVLPIEGYKNIWLIGRASDRNYIKAGTHGHIFTLQFKSDSRITNDMKQKFNIVLVSGSLNGWLSSTDTPLPKEVNIIQ